MQILCKWRKIKIICDFYRLLTKGFSGISRNHFKTDFDTYIYLIFVLKVILSYTILLFKDNPYYVLIYSLLSISVFALQLSHSHKQLFFSLFIFALNAKCSICECNILSKLLILYVCTYNYYRNENKCYRLITTIYFHCILNMFAVTQ